MLFLRPEDIVVEERQRKVFDAKALDELENSILEHGLIHPPAVRRKDGAYVLVAGERRLRACTNIIALGHPIAIGTEVSLHGSVPVFDLGDLEDAQAFSLELEENIKRKDLTWQERAIAESRVAELKGLQHAAQNLPPPTVTQIAATIAQAEKGTETPVTGNKITAVASRLQLAKHLDDPEVAAAKTEADAIKIVRKRLEQKRVQTLAAAFDAETERNSPHRLLEGDFREHITGIESGTVDVLLTDPPYGIGADTFGEQSGTGHNYQDSEEYFSELINVLAEESYRVTKPQAHAYVFCDPRRFNDLSLAFSFVGWEVYPIPLIWAKGNGMLPRPEHAPRRVYECILYALKGSKPVKCVKGDVINISAVRRLQHGAQKPVDLYVDLLSRSAVPGDVVLDPFAGSGTIFPAANRTKVKAIGIELSPENVAIAKLRMDNEEDEIEGLEALDL